MATAPKDSGLSKVFEAVSDFLEDLQKLTEKTLKLAQQNPDAKQIQKLQVELKATQEMMSAATALIKQLGEAAKEAARKN